MISSESGYSEAFVWIWLPGATVPVVAGKLTADADKLIFNYGKSYLNRKNAISKNWNTVCEEAGLSETDRALLWGRQYLNPFAFDDLEGEFANITKIASEMRTAKKR